MREAGVFIFTFVIASIYVLVLMPVKLMISHANLLNMGHNLLLWEFQITIGQPVFDEEEIVHGIPYREKEFMPGDICCIGCVIYFQGFHADCASVSY